MKSSMLKYKWMCVAVLCCAMFAACEPTEVASDQNPISFGSGRKQALINTINARLWGYTTGTNSYWVFAGDTEDGLTEGENAEYIESSKTLTPNVIRYWANNQFYNFYSVWPVVDGNGISDIAFNKTNSQLSFKADIANQNGNTDFCIAAALDEKGDADRKDAVPMTYKHALSKVQFYGFSSTTGTTAKLTNFTITVPKSATVLCTLIEDTKADKKDAEGNITTAYPLDITYTLGAETAQLSSTGEFDLQDNITNANGIKVLEKLVLPMQDGTFHVEATYKIGDNTKTVKTDIEATWLPGKNYIYKFYIQPSGPIIFEVVKVEPWDNVSNELTFDVES